MNKEQDILDRLKEGEKDAFAEIYHKYFTELCKFIESFNINKPTCENLIQDLFLNIWLQRNSLKPKGTIKSYLYRGARNRAFDYLRHQKLERNYQDRLKWEFKIEKESNETISQSFEDDQTEFTDKQLIHAVYNTIELMPERMSLIFTLSKDEGLSYQEIADVLDISKKTVEIQMGRALKLLREKMADYFPKKTS